MVQDIRRRYGALEMGRFIGELVRTLMSAMVEDVLSETRQRLETAKPGSAQEVRGLGSALVGFSPAMDRDIVALKRFLFEHMYRHPHVMTSMNKAKKVVGELFAALAGDPTLLPPDWAAGCGGAGDGATAGVVRDYIAGMTDQFCAFGI